MIIPVEGCYFFSSSCHRGRGRKNQHCFNFRLAFLLSNSSRKIWSICLWEYINCSIASVGLLSFRISISFIYTSSLAVKIIDYMPSQGTVKESTFMIEYQSGNAKTGDKGTHFPFQFFSHGTHPFQLSTEHGPTHSFRNGHWSAFSRANLFCANVLMYIGKTMFFLTLENEKSWWFKQWVCN